jgi:hypothetical protein
MKLNKILPVITTVAAMGLALANSTANAVTIGFNEEIDNTLRTVTAELHTSDFPGIMPGELFSINKTIHNISSFSWSGFHIALLNCDNANHNANACVPSPDSDGVSFGEVVSESVWANTVSVALNGVAQTGWTVDRETGGVDAGHMDHIAFDFLNGGAGFRVKHDDTLSLSFDMSDNQPGFNTWRLDQSADVPEPGTLALVGLSIFALIGSRRKKGASSLRLLNA